MALVVRGVTLEGTWDLILAIFSSNGEIEWNRFLTLDVHILSCLQKLNSIEGFSAVGESLIQKSHVRWFRFRRVHYSRILQQAQQQSRWVRIRFFRRCSFSTRTYTRQNMDQHS